MGRVYRFVGMETGVILNGLTPAQRRDAYAADITYGTNNEFGFDYLRDNMASSLQNLVQREHYFAIVDEVDSILIDEARTPLIISGPVEQPQKWYTEFSRIAGRMERDVHYEVDEKKRTVGVTEDGITLVEDHLGVENLYESENTPLIGFLNNAVKAKELYRRDKDYVVVEGEVNIVDEHTGRMLAGRRYSEGMHQAIEAKEGVQIQRENQTLGLDHAAELLPDVLQARRHDRHGPDRGHRVQPDLRHGRRGDPHQPADGPRRPGRPRLQDRGRQVRRGRGGHLRAPRQGPAGPRRHHERGEVRAAVALAAEGRHPARGAQRQAARPGGAGRRHGRAARRGHRGHQHGRARHRHHARRQRRVHGRRGAARARAGPERGPGGLRGGLAGGPGDAPSSCVAADGEKVLEVGGLYVLGTERHESRRIDNQLRGRSGRQGDAGESRFYLALTDDLMRMFNSGLVESFLTRAGIPDDMPIESGMVSRSIESAQKQVEGRNFEIRKNVLKYDDVLNMQRTVIYKERRRVLEHADLGEEVRHFAADVVEGYVRAATAGLARRRVGPGPAVVPAAGPVPRGPRAVRPAGRARRRRSPPTSWSPS